MRLNRIVFISTCQRHALHFIRSFWELPDRSNQYLEDPEGVSTTDKYSQRVLSTTVTLSDSQVVQKGCQLGRQHERFPSLSSPSRPHTTGSATITAERGIDDRSSDERFEPVKKGSMPDANCWHRRVRRHERDHNVILDVASILLVAVAVPGDGRVVG